jgi:hypothetical protein
MAGPRSGTHQDYTLRLPSTLQPVESQIPVLHQLLDAVSEEELGKMQVGVMCECGECVT